MSNTEKVQQDLEINWTEDKSNTLKRLCTDLEDILIVKESLATDKAMISWLKEGDGNTAYFHASIRARRKQNHMSLQRPDGSSTDDALDIGKSVVEYYQNHFNQYTPPPPMDNMRVLPSLVTDQMNTYIISIPNSSEIKEALKSMNPIVPWDLMGSVLSFIYLLGILFILIWLLLSKNFSRGSITKIMDLNYPYPRS